MRHFRKARLFPDARAAKRPFCGWFDLIRLAVENLPESVPIPENDNMLFLIEINLFAYRKTDIPDEVCAKIRTLLTDAAGKRGLILRFLYDWDGFGKLREPDSGQIILRHLEQLGGALAQSNSVFLLQGLMIGSWGEMHTTRYGSDAWLEQLFAKAAASFGSIPIALRTPHIREKALTLLPAEAGRTGIFNDGLCGSANDLGTFSENDGTARTACAKEVPYGGELLCGEEFDAARCCAYLSETSVSYLNGAYDPEALKKLKERTYRGTMTYYDIVSARLGYAFRLTHLSVRHRMLFVTVRNEGFAANYQPLTLFLYAGNDRYPFEGKTMLKKYEKAVYSVPLPDTDSALYCAAEVGGKACEFNNRAEGKRTMIFLGQQIR